VKAELCPGVNVIGNVSALTLKPAPMAVTLVTVTLVPPEFVMEAGWLWVLPTATLPKLRLAGLKAKAPALPPVPESATLRLGTELFDVNMRLPETVPLADGVNVTLKVRLCPAAKVVGKLSPVVLKPAPLSVAAEILTVAPPVFVRVSVCV
jgi:hypothetical protein